jgi:hypothetical protein
MANVRYRILADLNRGEYQPPFLIASGSKLPLRNKNKVPFVAKYEID